MRYINSLLLFSLLT